MRHGLCRGALALMVKELSESNWHQGYWRYPFWKPIKIDLMTWLKSRGLVEEAKKWLLDNGYTENINQFNDNYTWKEVEQLISTISMKGTE